SFVAVQHYSRKECELPCSPDLWTNIDLRESYIEAEYDLRPIPKELSALSSFVFDPRIMPKGRVHLVTEDLAARTVTTAGIVASGIARRYDYRKVEFSVGRTFKPGVDNVLVGKRAFAEKMLGARSTAVRGL